VALSEDVVQTPTRRNALWLARFLVGLVFLLNLQCALSFVWQAAAYTSVFEVQGASGEVLVRGMGVLFLMWNVPYALALWHPERQRTSLWEATVMQAIGLVGETLLLWTLTGDHGTLRAAIARFIIFDSGGLLALVVAILLTGSCARPPWRHRSL
jgi:hypothetical protein